MKDLEFGVIYPVDENFTFPFTVNDTTQFINRFELIIDNLHNIEPHVENTLSIENETNSGISISTLETCRAKMSVSHGVCHYKWKTIVKKSN